MKRPDRRRGPPPPPAKDAKRVLRIAGLNAVREVFRATPERIDKLYFVDGLKEEMGPVCVALARARKPYRIVGPEELARLAETAMHGGVLALVTPRPLHDLDAALTSSWAKAREPVLILDGVGNPHNLGAIARTAAYFGLRRLLLSGHPGQALPSDAAYRVAQGGLEHLDLYRVPELARALRAMAQNYRVLATGLAGGVPLEALRPDPRPVALVLGNEEAGLPQATLEAADAIITIPGAGRIQSLNVAASAAILIHAVCKVPPPEPMRGQKPDYTHGHKPR